MKIFEQLKYRQILFAGIGLVSVLSLYAANTILSNNDNASQEIRNTQTVTVTEVTNASAKTNTKSKKIKIALLLDTSNSMDGLIEQAKSQLWTIVNELAAAKCDSEKPEVLISLYEYGNQGLSSESGYIRQVAPLTDDLDKISDDLFKLTTNGGDEYCGQVIQTATKQLEWSQDGDDLQIIFIAGNEPFTQGRVQYQKACDEAKKKNIIVNTIFCGDFNDGISSGWKNGADITSGSYMSIDQTSKTIFIPSPYDDQITELNNKLNSTYIEYGREGKMKKESQINQDLNAANYSKSNEVNRTMAKTSHIYKNKSWDMVDASDDKEFDVTKVQSEYLPDTMKSMTNEQKVKYVEQKKSEREKIKAEITELSKKRQAYIITKEKENQGEEKMLNKSMINSIKKQAESKNFKF